MTPDTAANMLIGFCLLVAAGACIVVACGILLTVAINSMERAELPDCGE